MALCHDGISGNGTATRRGAGERMRGRAAGIAAVALLAAAPVGAQQASPYAGQETREIKSLSADEVRDLEAGAGMGFAKPAELNGYPGPRHVLDLADQLALEPGQREQVQLSFDRMHQRAVDAGRELIAAERDLDALFAGGAAAPEQLEAAVARAAQARAHVRLAHLEAHLEMRDVLTPDQVAAYTRLRGYGTTGHDPSRHHH